MFFLDSLLANKGHECDIRKITKKYKSVISPILQQIF